MGRIGGFERDSPEAFRKLDVFLEEFPVAWKDSKIYLKKRIFMDRTINVGSISAEQAISYGFTGPNLRAAGVDYDVRIAQPYSSYDDFDFIIPVGTSEIPMIVLRS
jgi:NADH-quinone oxidoreductase subunit D